MKLIDVWIFIDPVALRAMGFSPGINRTKWKRLITQNAVKVENDKERNTNYELDYYVTNTITIGGGKMAAGFYLKVLEKNFIPDYNIGFKKFEGTLEEINRQFICFLEIRRQKLNKIFPVITIKEPHKIKKENDKFLIEISIENKDNLWYLKRKLTLVLKRFKIKLLKKRVLVRKLLERFWLMLLEKLRPLLKKQIQN